MKLLIFFTVMAVVSNFVFAAGLAVKGNYRVRGTSIRNLHMDSEAKTSFRNYLDHRFRFNAAFVANDLIVIRSDFDVFGNCDGKDGSSFGCLLGHNIPSDESHPSENGLFNRWAADNNNTFHTKRLWAEITTRYGILKAGRVPDSWGVGIYANDGSALWDNYGDSLDRILFEMKYGSVTLIPFYGNFSERSIDATNDYTELGFKILYHMANTKSVYGFYLVSRSARPSKTNSLSTYDLFAKHNFGFMHLDLELVFQSGKLETQKIDNTGIIARLSKDMTNWFNTSVEVGMASGDNDGLARKVYSFNPDFRPTLIMFAHEYGTMPFRMKRTANDTNGFPAAVHNAIYFKPKTSFKFGYSQLDLSFIWGQRQESDQRSIKKNLGYELDVNYNYKSTENLVFGADLGIMLPGEYYKYMDNNVKDTTFATYLGLRTGIVF